MIENESATGRLRRLRSVLLAAAIVLVVAGWVALLCLAVEHGMSL